MFLKILKIKRQKYFPLVIKKTDKTYKKIFLKLDVYLTMYVLKLLLKTIDINLLI